MVYVDVQTVGEGGLEPDHVVWVSSLLEGKKFRSAWSHLHFRGDN